MQMEEARLEADARQWAQEQFERVELGDVRLARRAVVVAARMAALPGESLPHQMQSHNELTATYRLLDNQKVTHAALSQPHWQATRERAAQEPLVLLTQDRTELDYTHYARTMVGLGPIGDGRGRGLLLHTTLAVVPEPRQVLGIAYQRVFERQPLPEGQYRRRRPKAERESRVWCEAVGELGHPPEGSRWVVVADREGDHTDFLRACRVHGLDFTVRLGYPSRVIVEGTPHATLFAAARSWEPVVGKVVEVRGRGGRRGRRARVLVSFGRVHLRVPKAWGAFPIWVVRAWEVDAPADVEEPLEWILATSVDVESATEALERLAWYTARWLNEEYHQCLKTGCAVEGRDLEEATRIERLLGLLALVAVRLLQLREETRVSPDRPAAQVADPLLVELVAAQLGTSAAPMTVGRFWRGVAQLGGFQGRRSDGEPGWKTLWRGWLYLEALAQGARLAASLPDRRLV